MANKAVINVYMLNYMLHLTMNADSPEMLHRNVKLHTCMNRRYLYVGYVFFLLLIGNYSDSNGSCTLEQIYKIIHYLYHVSYL